MDAVDSESDETEARRFGAASRRLFLLSALFSLLAPLAVWTSGTSAAVWRSLTTVLPIWVATPAFVALSLLVLATLLLPTSYAAGLVLPRSFGLSYQSTRAWLRDWLVGTALSVALGTLVGGAYYVSLDALGDRWWAPFGLLMALGTLALAFIMPYVVLPLFFRVQPVRDAALVERVRALFERAHAGLAAVVTLDFSRRTRRANAAVMGLGRSRKVVLSDTLLAQFSADEIESVVAHELGHHVLGHIRRLVIAQVVSVGFGLALAVVAGPPLLAPFGARLEDRAAFPLVVLSVELYSLLALPVANAFSRRLEREADRFAWRLTGQPGAFGAAMRRLGRINLVETVPPRWAVLLLGSHPPLGERVRAAEASSA